MDVYRYMYKLAPSSAEKIISQSTGASLPAGYLTDGLGNIYKIPTKGKTPLVSINEDDRLKYSYNWQTGEIEIYGRDDENKYSFLTSYGVTPENFADGPEYWFNQAKEDVDDEIESELAWMDVPEGFLDFDLGDEKDNYVYHIRFNYDITNDELDDWEAAYDSVESILLSYDIKQELYTQEISIKANKEDNEIVLAVRFPMELTKEELLEIWNTYEEHIQSLLKDAGYKVELNIEGIFEV